VPPISRPRAIGESARRHARANYNFRRFVEFTERNNRAVTLLPEIENPDRVAYIEKKGEWPESLSGIVWC
jgi:hypothetical protein